MRETYTQEAEACQEDTKHTTGTFSAFGGNGGRAPLCFPNVSERTAPLKLLLTTPWASKWFNQVTVLGENSKDTEDTNFGPKDEKIVVSSTLFPPKNKKTRQPNALILS